MRPTISWRGSTYSSHHAAVDYEDIAFLLYLYLHSFRFSVKDLFVHTRGVNPAGFIKQTKKTCKARQSGLYHVLSDNVSRYFTTGNERCRDQGILQRDVAFSQEIPRQAQEALEHTSRTKHHRVCVRGCGVLLFGRVSVGNVCPAWMQHQRGPDGIEIAGDMRDVLSP